MTASSCTTASPRTCRRSSSWPATPGYHFQLLTAVIEVNELQKRRVVGKLEAHLGPLRGRRIALLGLAFKANTDDMREASSLVLSARLLAEGAAVVAYDPVARDHAAAQLDPRVEIAGSMLAAVSGADALVIVTEWGEFRSVASTIVRAAMATPLIVDGRNLLDPAQARLAGSPTSRSAGRARPRSPRDRSHPGGWPGDTPAAADRVAAQADAADREPALSRAPDRPSAGARHRPRDPLLRLPARRDPGALRRPPRVRRGGLPAGHGRRDRESRPAAWTRRSSSATATSSPSST